MLAFILVGSTAKILDDFFSIEKAVFSTKCTFHHLKGSILYRWRRYDFKLLFKAWLFMQAYSEKTRVARIYVGFTQIIESIVYVVATPYYQLKT
jgi:hypothetical protein